MIGVIRNGMNLLAVDAFFQLIVIGVVIVLAVEADVLRGHLEDRFRVAEAAGHDGHADASPRSRSEVRRSASAPSSRSTTLTSRSSGGRCSPSSATTAPASPR